MDATPEFPLFYCDPPVSRQPQSLVWSSLRPGSARSVIRNKQEQWGSQSFGSIYGRLLMALGGQLPHINPTTWRLSTDLADLDCAVFWGTCNNVVVVRRPLDVQHRRRMATDCWTGLIDPPALRDNNGALAGKSTRYSKNSLLIWEVYASPPTHDNLDNFEMINICFMYCMVRCSGKAEPCQLGQQGRPLLRQLQQ